MKTFPCEVEFDSGVVAKFGKFVHVVVTHDQVAAMVEWYLSREAHDAGKKPVHAEMAYDQRPEGADAMAFGTLVDAFVGKVKKQREKEKPAK